MDIPAVFFMGADTPRTDFVRAFERYAPQVVVLAATAKLLLALAPRLTIVAGGASDAIDDATDEHHRIAIAEALPVVEQEVARTARRQS